jgi:DNA-binding transcriptional LysR family regulator
MDLRVLRSFVAVAEELHFTRAARRLHLAQPALSQQIRQLERDLKLQLFERSKHSVRLTEAGRVFLEHVRNVLQSAETAELEAQRAARGEIGRLVIGFTGAAADLISPTVREYRSRFPKVDLVVRVALPQEQYDGLLHGRMHLGINHDVVDDARLESEVLRGQPLMFALAADHPLAGREAIAIGDLRDEPFIMGPAGANGYIWGTYQKAIMAVCAEAGFVPFMSRHASDTETRLTLVAAGIGVAPMLGSPRLLTRSDIVYRPLSGPPIIVKLFAVWRRDAGPAAFAFLDTLRACARGLSESA